MLKGSRALGRARKLLGMVASAAVVATSLVVVGGTVTAAPAQALPPLLCTGETAYVIKTNGGVHAVNTANSSTDATQIFQFTGLTGNYNALGLSGDGAIAYAATPGPNGGIQVYSLTQDRVTNTASNAGLESILRGGVNPVNGMYYFASGGSTATLAMYNPTTNQSFAVGTIGGMTNNMNGDLAFSASGDMLVINGTDIYSIKAADIPTTPGNGAIPRTLMAAVNISGQGGNGIAFGDRGHLFLSGNDGTVYKRNPATGAAVGQSAGVANVTDMASCAYPNTISLKKDIPNERFASSDQFNLRIDGQPYLGAPQGGPNGPRPEFVAADTNGPASGVQANFAGPVFVAGSDTFNLRESGLFGADLRDYDVSIACVDEVNGDPVSTVTVGDIYAGGHWTVQQPNNLSGSDVVCTVSNDRSDITLTKTTDPDPASYDAAGDTLTYVLRAENTGPTTLTEVLITDPKLGELEFSEWSGAPNAYAQTLQPGEWVEFTGSYTVTQTDVDRGAVDNTAEATGKTPAGNDARDTDEVTVVGTPASAIEVVKTADKTTLIAGETVEYTFVAENTGDTTLTGVTIVDPLPGLTNFRYTEWPGAPANDPNVGGNSITLLPDQTVTAKADLPVTLAHVESGQVHNTVTASGQPPTPVGGTTPPRVTGTHDVTLTAPYTPRISIEKSVADGTSFTRAGDIVTFDFKVENIGNVGLTAVGITDAMLGGEVVLDDAVWSGTVGTLNPGQTMTVSVAYTVTQADIDNGFVYNSATSHGTPPGDPADPDDPRDPVVSPPAEVTVPGPARDARIDLEKTGVLEPFEGETPAAGDTVSYTLVATNTGNVTLTDVSIADGLPGFEIVGTDWSEATAPQVLAPGDRVTVTGTYTLTLQDLGAGAVVNVGTTTGTPPNVKDPSDPTGPGTPANPVTDEDPETVTYDRDPRISLEKRVQADQTFGAEGDTVVYEFILTNTGTTSLTALAITDDLLGADADYTYHWDESSAAEAGTLEPGDSVRVTAPYVLTQADVDRGWVANEAEAEGTPPPTIDPADPDGPRIPSDPVTDDDRHVEPIAADPELTLEKDGVLDDGAAEGDTVTYTFTVANTGNVTLTDVEVIDPLLGGAALPVPDDAWPGAPGVLAPGDVVIFTAQYALTQGDVDAGVVHNIATSHGTPPPTIDPEDPDNPEPKDPIDSPPASETIPLPSDAKIELEKTAVVDIDADAFPEADDTVTYTFVARNTGNVTLTDVTITDPMFPAGITIADDAWPNRVGTLEPTESVTGTAVLTLTQELIDAGWVENTARTTGTPPETYNPEDPENPIQPPNPEDTDRVVTDLDPNPSIRVEKSGALAGQAVAEELVEYTFTITNTGNVTLADVVLEDPLISGDPIAIDAEAWPDPEAPGVLRPQESVTATATYALTLQDLDSGSLVNIAYVEGTPPPSTDPEDPQAPPVPNPKVDDSDPHTLPLPQSPALQLQKSSELQGDAVAGSTVEYGFTVTNIGNVTLTDVRIDDPLPGLGELRYEWPGDAGVLAPGESATAEADYTVTQADVDAGQVANTAVAEGTPPPSYDPENPETPIPGDPIESPPADTTTPLPGQPSIALTKSSELQGPAAVGSVIEYTLVATNTGNVTLTGVKIIDELKGLSELVYAWPGSAGVLAPGQSVTATATYTVTQADVDAGEVHNTAIAEATPPPTVNPDNPDEPITSDPVGTPEVDNNTLLPSASQISLEKSAELRGEHRVGSTIVYSFRVTNEGNTTLRDVRVEDPLPGLSALRFEWPGEPGVLLPGESAIATAEYRLTAADIERGSVENRAVVFATDPSGNQVEHTDGVTVDFESLSNTGGSPGALALLGTAGALLLIAGGVLLARRSRKESV